MKYTTNYNIPKPEDNNIDVFNVETLHTILDSIDSLTKMVENINAQIPQTNATAEVIEARGTFSTLDGRIDDVETKAATASTDASSAVGDVTAHTGNGTIHVVKDGTLQTGLNAEKVGGKKITEIGSALILANNAHTSTDLPSTYPLGISMFWLSGSANGFPITTNYGFVVTYTFGSMAFQDVVEMYIGTDSTVKNQRRWTRTKRDSNNFWQPFEAMLIMGANITYGTSAPGTLAEGEIYLQIEA